MRVASHPELGYDFMTAMTVPYLKKSAAYIDGQWRMAKSGATFTVHNPATGEAIAKIPHMGSEETKDAVVAAARALEQPTSLAQRQAWLSAIGKRMLEVRDDLATIITLEQGKPLPEAKVEVEYAAGFFSFFATQLEHLKPRPLPGKIRDSRWTVHNRPAGVAGLITPWNFPLAMLAKKLAPAIAADCGIVIKPAELTPLSAMAQCQIINEIGLPAPRVNLVSGDAGAIGRVLCEHPAVRVISFTGSTRTGKVLLEQTAAHIKRLSLELGGNAPFIVFDDADLESAADSLIANKFRCAGQTCVCANRIYVQRSIAARFTDLVAARVDKLKVGNGMEPGIDLGPLINRAAWDKVSEHVQDALKKGARRLAGKEAQPPKGEWGNFYPPTVLADANETMLAFQEETFGPIVTISEFESESEVIARANGTPYGLASYVFSRDDARCQRCAAALHFGHVAINTGTGPTPEAPFGGMKQSGFGREGGTEGLHEFCEVQTVVVK